MMDCCDRMATWYAHVLATNEGAGRCHQIRGKRLTIVYPGDVTLGFFFVYSLLACDLSRQIMARL